ncbi:MAG TPA: NAD-dependent epimerase/dehydratase family protein [Burkholderiaceae bacterium]|nr:NAD-dependent epimerase/dehydratase family protein [Burkholderiaceae bacterium]
MAEHALIIGGTGQVGRVAAQRLLQDGWRVTVLHRGGDTPAAGARGRVVDRNDDAALDAVLAEGFDVVIDLLAFRLAHAQQLLRNASRIGSVIVLSTAAVYRDADGLTLMDVRDEATCPRFDGPVGEGSAVVAPDDEGYAGRKRSIELALLESGPPTTVLRAGAIYGPRSPQPREWFYVKRLLDGRRTVALGFGGRGSLHPVSVFNLAEVIRLAAHRAGHRVLNVGDPGLPDERAIAAAIANAMDREIIQVLLPGAPPVASPWSVPHPFFLATTAAEHELGYVPLCTLADAVRTTCRSIVQEVESGGFEVRLSDKFGTPGLGCQVFVGRGAAPFDYAAEDRLLESIARRASAGDPDLR